MNDTTLEARVAALEVSGRRWRAATVVLGGLLAALALGGWSAGDINDVIWVREIRLVNASGRLMGRLAAESTGASLMMQGGESERHRVMLVADDRNAGLRLWDHIGRSSVGLRADAEESGINLRSPGEIMGVDLGAHPKMGELTIRNRVNKAMFCFDLAGSEPGLVAYDGKASISMRSIVDASSPLAR